MSADKLKVLMIGPDRSVHGGISALVNSYYDCGLDSKVDLKYIGTMREGSKLKKLLVAAGAYLSFAFCVQRFDIVHVNVASDNSFRRKALFIKCAKKHGKKIVIHQHGGDFKNFYHNQITPEYQNYIKDILGSADRMLVLTESWKEFFSDIVDPSKITVLPNGVSTAGARFEDIPRDKNLNNIIFMGRICKDKGIDELIHAVKEIYVDNPLVKLYLGGIFEDSQYKDKVKENEAFINYLGWISGKEKEQYLNKCGILVLPSYYEGFPVSILDGMLKGLVVVASSVGGIPEIIEDGRDGILVEPGNAQMLKEKLLEAMGDKDRAKDMSKNAFEKVENKFSLEKIVDNLIEIYKNL